MATAVPTVSDFLLERCVERLGRYRELVHRAATGWSLTEAEAAETDVLLEQLELPGWCLRRDVAAMRAMFAEQNERRRLELLWIYPHLFSDRRQWAELRRDERGRRRRIMAQLRQAISNGD